MIRSERGFTLIEILIAFLVFAMVVLGTGLVLGAATAGGFLDIFPTSFSAIRVARDYTTASTYLQSFQEFMANKGSGSATAGKYCYDRPESVIGCSAPNPLPADYPSPATAGYQLNWDKLEVVIEDWYWNGTAERYCPEVDYGSGESAVCTAGVSSFGLKLVQSTLYWEFKGQTRASGGCSEIPGLSCVTVRRFLR